MTSDMGEFQKCQSKKNWILAKGEIEWSFTALRGAGVSTVFEIGNNNHISLSGGARATGNHHPAEQRRGKVLSSFAVCK